jgi:hypothetical protein
MLEALLDFMFHILFFYVGAAIIRVITIGKVSPRLNESRNPMLISLFGFVVTFAVIALLVSVF